MIAIDDPDKPLRSKVLAVPKYRDQYLANIRQLAEESLDWNFIGRFVTSQSDLIDEAVKNETRKLGSYEAFRSAVSTNANKPAIKSAEQRRGHGAMNLKDFFDGRRKCLLK